MNKGTQGDQSPCANCSSATCSASTKSQNESDEEFIERQRLSSRLCRIKHKILVMSGKGGVGKSTVAVNLAMALSLAGKNVGLLDVDIHGPSVPTMVGLEGATLHGDEDGMLPVEIGGLKVMSIGFLLRSQDDAVIWRGPRKYSVIKQFISDVVWGELDYLIIDSPPGTGDEPLSVCQLIDLDGAVVVTTPQRVSEVDVRKSISFCEQLKAPIVGVVENMAGFVCPKCGEMTPIFRSGGGQRICESMGVNFLGSIPIDPAIPESCDQGLAFVHRNVDTPTGQAFRKVIEPILAMDERCPQPAPIP